MLETQGNWFDTSVVDVERVGVRTLRDFFPRGRIGDLAVRVPGDRYLGLADKLQGADIVHSQDLVFWYSMQAAKLKRELGYKLVLTVWETLPFMHAYRNVRTRPYRDRGLRETDLFLCATERARLALLLEGADDNRIRICPPGVDVELFEAARPTTPLDHHLVVSPGRLVWEKGHQDVIRAVATLRYGLVDGGEAARDIRALIIGKGPEERRLRAYARELGVADAVEIRRNVPYSDMPGVYAQASCLVLASLPVWFWEEQFGMVLVEAIAAGLPIVASTSGAIPEVVGDQASYFAPGDWIGLVRALARGVLARPPGERASYDPRAREGVLKYGRRGAARHGLRGGAAGVTAGEDERLRILFTVHHPLDPNAGAAGATLNLGRAMERLGHQVDYFSFDDLPAWLMPRARHLLFPEITAFAVRRHVDVLDAMTGDAWLWALSSRKPSGRRPLLVTRAHGIEHVFHEARVAEARANGAGLPLLSRLYDGGLRLREVELSLRRADLALFLNDDDLVFAIERLGVLPDHAARTRNGIADGFLGRPLKRAGPGLELGIAHLGTYHERKGIRYGVPALRALLQRHPTVRAGFIGAGCPREQVLQNFPENLRDRIDVVPAYSNQDLPHLLEGYHIQLFPTLAEGGPLVLLEAMACGLAPVTTRTRGPLATVEPGRDGLVVAASRLTGAEEALERLVTDRSLLERLRAAAHAKAQGYGWDEVARETLALYRKRL